jgi:hypothetical protein
MKSTAAPRAYGGDDGSRAENADDGEDAAEDAGGEGAHQHLEALTDPVRDEVVELLDQVAAERAHDERPEEHRDVGPDYRAHGGYRADDAASRVVDYPAPCKAN